MAAIRLPVPRTSWRERVKGSPARVRTLKASAQAGTRRLVVTGTDPRRKRG